MRHLDMVDYAKLLTDVDIRDYHQETIHELQSTAAATDDPR